MGTNMKSNNGPTVSYELVYCLFKKPIMQLEKNKPAGQRGRYFVKVGDARGFLVRSTGADHVWYHYPEDYLQWKHEA